MAKKENKSAGTSNGSAVLERTAPPTVPATPSGGAPEVAPSAAATGPGWTDAVGGAVVSSVQVVRGVLPASRVPVYLAGAALMITGLVDPPVALAAGLAYEALRRWEPQGAH